MGIKHTLLAGLCAALIGTTLVPPVQAEPAGFTIDVTKKKRALRLAPRPSSQLTVQSWMSPEIGDAWRQGFRGQGTTITVVDQFNSGASFSGNLGTGAQALRHGEWTRMQAGLVAPSAALRAHDLGSGASVGLVRGLNVINLSYGIFAPNGHDPRRIRWSQRESSLISHAMNGRAVIAKAAGNDRTAVGSANGAGHQDYLNTALIGAPSAIFVGALSTNGSVSRPASMASYSNFAGTNAAVQNQFLVVGVEGHRTGLYGTSFAAPIVSGYSAILGSKFTNASPSQITNQLLTTARRDTIANYNSAVHGRGEASLSRALAPASIR